MRRHLRIAWTMVGAVVAVTALGAQAPQGPPPPPRPPAFRAGTTLVPLDVRVLDKKGRPVTDLTAEDFTVLEDGAGQRIRFFSVQAPHAATAAAAASDEPLPRRTAPITALAPSTYRVFLIFLGRGDLTGPADGVDGVIHLVKDRLLPQDRVAILAWNRATDFTTDHASALAVLGRFKKQYRKIDRQLVDYFRSPAYFYGNRTLPAYVQDDIDAVFKGEGGAPMRSVNAQLEVSLQQEQKLREQYDLFNAPSSDRISQLQREAMGLTLEEFFEQTASTMQDQSNIYAGIEYLRHLEGEKHMVWLSDTGLFRSIVGSYSPVENDRDIGRAAADARVVIDVIRSGGTVSPNTYAAENRTAVRYNPIASMQALQPAATSRMLADITGGRSDANRFANAAASADAIDQASRYQYLLGYYPTNSRWDGRFRNIRVTVNRPDVTVLVRRGYYARDDVAGFDRQGVVTYSRIAAAAGDFREVLDMPLKVRATGAASDAVSVTLTVDVSRVLFRPANGHQIATLQVAAFCLDARQRPVGDAQQAVELAYTDERLAEVRREGVPLTLRVPVRAPAEVVKVVVYSFAADLTGSRNVKIEP